MERFTLQLDGTTGVYVIVDTYNDNKTLSTQEATELLNHYSQRANDRVKLFVENDTLKRELKKVQAAYQKLVNAF